MRIAFIDFSPLEYDPDTPRHHPLGGSQSALCYLSEALVQRGASSVLFTSNAENKIVNGVECRPTHDLDFHYFRQHPVDALVVLNAAASGPRLASIAPEECLKILWVSHATDQPDVASLSDLEVRNAFDQFAFFSDWQGREFLRVFALDEAKTAVRAPAIAPFFEELFPRGEKILAAKNHPPVLAYASTPFRGLDLLLALFPLIRHWVPEVRLNVYASMKGYQQDNKEETQRFGELYDRCRSTQGVEYIGSLSQRELAVQLKQAAVLAYPNTFTETASIAVMEAMAAGCWIVTSDLGALPETLQGFGRLISLDQPIDDYAEAFAAETARVLILSFSDNPAIAEAHLARQIAFASRRYSWSARAMEWERWIGILQREGG